MSAAAQVYADIVAARKSVRAFRPEPVDLAEIVHFHG